MNDKQKSLLELLANSLFHVPTNVMVTEEIIMEAQRHAVRGLIDKKSYGEFVNNVMIQRAHSDLSSILEGIPFTIIKGCASAYYYPEPIRRAMGDVDFLVDSHYINDTEERLINAGCRFLPDHEAKHHRGYGKGNVIYEMHTEVNGIPDDDKEIQKLLIDTVSTSKRVVVDNGYMIIPDDFHNGLICLLHILSHMRQTGIGLRHFCDWACLVNRVEMFEKVFRNRLEAVGLWKCARMLSLTAHRYIGLPYQEWMGSDNEDIVDRLMDEILNDGNFGSANEIQEANWFVDKKTSTSKVKGLLNQLNKSVIKHWPIVKRYPILYPIGWIASPLLYFTRILQKKRKPIRVFRALNQAEQKNKLLYDLQLFIKENG